MGKKHKINIDRRIEVREGEHRIYDDTPLDDLNALDEAMANADWTDDPGTGKAVILADGRELLNPIPVAPPLSITASAEPSVNELVERALARHFAGLQDTDEVDGPDDYDDFPEDDEWHPMSQYEVVLIDEAPAVPAAPPVSEEVRSDLERLEKEAAKAAPDPKKKAGKTPPVIEEEEGA